MRVLVLSDAQAPFHHPQYIDYACRVRDVFKTDKTVLIGDEADFKFLKYANINDRDTPEQQHELTMRFLRRLYKEFPDVDIMESNHVHDRIAYASAQGNMPKFMVKTPKELFNPPVGWRWSESVMIDGVRYEHGHRLSGGKNVCERAIERRHCSVVFGHHAVMDLRFQRSDKTQLFGLCVGALTVNANDERMGYGMAYSKKYSGDMPLGLGVVIDGIWPNLVPFYGP